MTQWRKSVRVRLTLWYMLLLALTLIVFSSGLYLVLARGLYQQVDDGLRLMAGQFLGTINVDNGQLSLETNQGEDETATLAERGLLVRIVDAHGRVVDSSGPFRDLRFLPPVVTETLQVPPTFMTVDAPGEAASVRVYSVPYEENGRVYGLVQIGQSLETVQTTLHSLLLVLALAVPVTLALASLGGLFLAGRALAPIDDITRAAQRISAEDLGHRLNLSLPDDEVGRLAGTFDDMLARLDNAFRRQRQFTADASHEMRTPLTVMKGDIDVTLNRTRSVAEYQQVLADLEEEVDRLIRLVEDLLFLARADSSHPLVNSEPLDMASLLQAIVEQMRPLAEAKGQTLTCQVPDALPMHGDADKLIQLFLNLLDNAIKYTPPGGTVSVRAVMTLAREGDGLAAPPTRRPALPQPVRPPAPQALSVPGVGPPMLVIEVSDSGPGIPPEHLPHIFERFYRADEARSRAAGGLGLGLAIGRWIVEAHGGVMEVQSAPQHGTTFTVRLPGARG